MVHHPGEVVPENQSGDYRCLKCGNKIRGLAGKPFPPCKKTCPDPTFILIRRI